MPAITQSEEVNARATCITIRKGVGTVTKLYKENPKPLPHQQDVLNHFVSSAFKSPMWLLFKVGSGKTLTSLFCALQLPKAKVCVICSVSLLGQWATVIRKLHTPPGFVFQLIAFSQFEILSKKDEIEMRKFDLAIVDEAQEFRNLSARMQKMIDDIRRCPRVLLLSGTPIVNSGEDEQGFKYLCCGTTSVSLKQAAAGRVAVYNPQTIPKFAALYPRVERHTVNVIMSWPQTLVYASRLHNEFKMKLQGELWSVTRPINNRYNVALVSALNMPFDDPKLSPKLMALAAAVKTALKPVVVYSSRIEKGIEPIFAILQDQQLKVACIDGSTAARDRTKIMKQYNSGGLDVLIISPASSRGIDLLKTGSFMILEPHQNISDENQTIARAVRYKSHMGIEDACVHVYSFLCAFPTKQTLSAQDSKALTGELQTIFGPDCDFNAAAIIKGLAPLIADMKKTNDQIQACRNIEKHKEVTKCMDVIDASTISMPLTQDAIKKGTAKGEMQVEEEESSGKAEKSSNQKGTKAKPKPKPKAKAVKPKVKLPKK